MSDGDQGGASAPPAVSPTNGQLTGRSALDLIEHAERELASIADPATAEGHWRKVKGLDEAVRAFQLGGEIERRAAAARLRAERHWGELLGPAPEPGRPEGKNVSSGNVTGAQRLEQHKARKVAAVSDEDFEDYLAEASGRPTRSGLLKAKGEKPKPPPKRKPQKKRKAADEATVTRKGRLVDDPAVLAWVRRLVRRGWTRAQVVAASKAKDKGWPGPADEPLSHGTFDEIHTAIGHIERLEAEAKARRARGEKSPQARRRERKGQAKANPNELLRVQVRASELIYILHSIDIKKYDLDDVLVMNILVDLHEDLTVLGEWWDRTIRSIQARLDEEPIRRRMAALREKTVANGAEPAEAESAQALADKMQHMLDAKLPA